MQGSGKSYFCARLSEAVSPRAGAGGGALVAVVNQDELASRKKCMAALEDAVGAGAALVCIDRMNLTAAERAEFIEAAKAFGEAAGVAVAVHCLVLDIPVRVCAQRIKVREHATVSGSKYMHLPNSSRMKYEEVRTHRGGEDVDFVSSITRSSAFDSAVAAYAELIASGGGGRAQRERG